MSDSRKGPRRYARAVAGRNASLPTTAAPYTVRAASSFTAPGTAYLLANELSSVRCLHDERGHRSGLRHVDRMATGNLDHGGAGPL